VDSSVTAFGALAPARSGEGPGGFGHPPYNDTQFRGRGLIAMKRIEGFETGRRGNDAAVSPAPPLNHLQREEAQMDGLPEAVCGSAYNEAPSYIPPIRFDRDDNKAIYFDMTARALGYNAGAFSMSDGTVVLKIGCMTLTLEAWWAKYERVEEMPPALREFLGFVRAVFNAQKKSEPVPVAVPQSATEF
jgi:hypothetical protein